MKTILRKSMHGGWMAESMTEANANGEAWQINTTKSGKSVKCYAVKGMLSNEMFGYEMFGAKRMDLAQQEGQCTESKVKAVHEAGLIEFSKIIEATPEVIKPSYVVGVGQIIFTDSMGNFEERNRVIYEVIRPGYFKTVSIDGLSLGFDEHIKPYTEKFGIGVYYNEGDIMPLDEVLKLVESGTKATNERETSEQLKRDEAEEKRLKDIEIGSKIISSIPAGITHVITANLHKNTSDYQSDYHAHEVEKVVYLAFSKHGKDIFSEMRKAAANYKETKFLSIAPEKPEGEAGEYWTAPDEHREKYSMGAGYYLGCYKDHSGYVVKKQSISLSGNDYGVTLQTLQIAAANGCYFIPTEEEQAEVKQATNYEPLPVETGKINIIDYSEKAIAVIGDTKPIKDKLHSLGGRFNFHLSCGAGWIFPKTKLEALKTALAG